MRETLVHLVVETEYRAHLVFDGGDLARRRIAAARDQQHQDDRGFTRIVDSAQRRGPLRLARLDATGRVPALPEVLADMVEAVHADEPIDQPEDQRACNQD